VSFEARTPLAVDGVVSLALEGASPFVLEGRGGRLTLRISRLRCVRTLLPGLGTRRARAARLAALAAWLRAADLALEVELRGRRVAALSRGSRPTWLASALALGDFEVRLRDVVAARLVRA
jgi:hypothetical protein